MLVERPRRGGALDAATRNDGDVADATAALREALGAGDLESAAERIVELNFYGKIDAEAREAADARGFGDLPRRSW